MIDSIKLYLPDFASEGGKLFNTLAEINLEAWNKGKGTALHYTKLDGYRFALNIDFFSFLYIYFSPYKRGTNGGSKWERQTGFAEVLESLQTLEKLGLNLTKATICQIEVGGTFKTSEPASYYFDCLGEKKRFRRTERGNFTTLYYNNKPANKKDKNSLKLYSKSKERGERLGTITKAEKTGYFARYECKYRQRRLDRILPTRRAAELLEIANYLRLVEAWYKDFLSIKKTGLNPQRYGELKTKIEGFFLRAKTLEKLEHLSLPAEAKTEVVKIVEESNYFGGEDTNFSK